ncbi:hypothetical protein TRIATDRAFT_298141 [Trichoderma atroviride IMI 206040]|uniref:Uncharacterized protein n=1 Tax=Hypocrea atroviridis (strain ATCC 20476 / IMI 206040) TaxID=452589 RepID=G9NLR3_HYPAI|nr:uncharacterized protein TRIATDRAFT_298141 [Trichoderma atroviride IMI 206040]EHK48823.1 hypothetical protein TRIATDRAFT_298141 [Trichoderma atroviride IMI 206040]
MICAMGVLFLFSFFVESCLLFSFFVNILFYYWRGELERVLDFMDTTQRFFVPFFCIKMSVY